MAGRGTPLKDRVALVTGGSRGIGLAITKAFLRCGASVAITGRKEAGLEEAKRELHDAGLTRIHTVVAHSAKQQQVSQAFDSAESKFGVVSIVVNNAATNPVFTALIDTEPVALEKILATNLHGYFLVAQETVHRLRKHGLPGSIINVSSVAGAHSWEGLGAYGVSKSAVNMMTQTLGSELGAESIRVNGIAPGLVRTKFSAALWQEPQREQAFTSKVPLGRLGEADDIADTAVFLASEEARYITGQTIVVDGGLTTR